MHAPDYTSVIREIKIMLLLNDMESVIPLELNELNEMI